MAVIIFMVSFFSCSKSANKDKFRIQGISTQNFPVVDGSTSTSPLVNTIACKLLGIPYEWIGTSIFGDTWITPVQDKIPADFDYFKRVLTSTTHGSIMNLIDKKADFILAARTMSDDEKAHAITKGISLTETPVALDAFVFIVNAKNPVKNLTTKQIQDIYTGKISNWREVGGNDAPIKPYMRNRNSGSQEKMEKLVMKGLSMNEFPVDIEISMAGPFDKVSSDENAICYTVYYYKEYMIKTSRVKHIAVDGVYPDKATIKSKSYPYTTEVFKSIRTDQDKQSMAYKIYELMNTPAGQDVVKESGYVPLQF